MNSDDPLQSSASPSEGSVPLGRSFLGGVLMGLANLVPGISGGTMILAIGLYERFIQAVADVSRLRLRLSSIQFLALVAAGLIVAVLSLSGPVVALVVDHRWVMYSLFVGLSLGGVPELWRLSSPRTFPVLLASFLGLALMAALAWSLTETRLESSTVVLLIVGAIAASSMILPGVSGSYILLILGMYDTVIGSLSLSALRADLSGSLEILVPIIGGAILGIGLLSNFLKWVLARHSAISHGALLGLLCGSVLGLFPFQEPVHPDLAQKRLRKATAAVLDGASTDQIRAEFGEDLTDARLQALAAENEGLTPAELKARGDQLQYFTPELLQILSSLGLMVLGFFCTRLLGRESAD